MDDLKEIEDMEKELDSLVSRKEFLERNLKGLKEGRPFYFSLLFTPRKNNINTVRVGAWTREEIAASYLPQDRTYEILPLKSGMFDVTINERDRRYYALYLTQFAENIIYDVQVVRIEAKDLSYNEIKRIHAMDKPHLNSMPSTSCCNDITENECQQHIDYVQLAYCWKNFK
jgi:hypothetical protein